MHWLTKSRLPLTLPKTLLPLLRVSTVTYCEVEQTSAPVKSVAQVVVDELPPGLARARAQTE